MSKLDEAIETVLKLDTDIRDPNGTSYIPALEDRLAKAAPRLARALRVAVDGLNDISNARHTAEHHSCGETVAAREVLAAIQKEFES